MLHIIFIKFIVNSVKTVSVVNFNPTVKIMQLRKKPKDLLEL